MKYVAWILLVGALVGVGIQWKGKQEALQQVSLLKRDLITAEAELEEARKAPVADPAELERGKAEREELARLRGEVSALRKEKAEWAKNRGSAETAAPAQSQPRPPQPTTPTEQGMQWVETIMNGPAQVKGTEGGNLRKKQLNGEPLTEAEQALLLNMYNRSAEIEKSPEEFSNFQSAYISSLLGWNNDPRSEAVKGVLNAAMNAAAQRGYDYHAPGENADKWDQAQTALNQRATGAVQNLLRPEERALFDKAFIGVLGVDFGMGVSK